VSGAGRGTPRVSPSQGAAPNPPVTPGGLPYGEIIDVTNAKFLFQCPGGTAQNLAAAGAVTAYTWTAASNLDFVVLPLGLTRGVIEFSYTQGALGGLVGIRFRFGGIGDRRIFYPTQPAALGDDFTARGREQILTSSSIVRGYLPFVIPPGANSLGVWVNEVGVPGSPGTFDIDTLYADNLAQGSLLPNNTSNL
jgi:hypothetical protein